MQNARTIYVPIMPALEEQIVGLITKVNVVEDKQLRRIFRIGEEEKSNNTFLYSLHDLFDLRGKLVTDEHLVVRADNPHVKTVTDIYGDLDSKIEGKVIAPYRKVTTCLWDVISHIDQVEVDLIEEAEQPATLIYTLELFGDPCRLTVVDVYVDESNLYILNQLQEKYLDRILWTEDGKPSKSVVLNYVATDTDLLETIIERSEPDDNGNIINPIYVPTILTYVDLDKTDDTGTPVVNHWTSSGESLRLLYAEDFEKVRNEDYAESNE